MVGINFYLVIALLISIMFGGYEHFAYKQYKTEVIAEAEKQKALTDKTNKWNDQVIKETNDAYQKRLADLNTKYGRLHYSSSGAMPPATTRQDSSVSTGEASHNLPLECAITTNMLVSLQDIIKETK